MKIVELNGHGRQRGQAHGESLRREIRELAEIRWQLLHDYCQGLMSRERMRFLINRQYREVVHYAGLYEEFLGLVEGSGLAPEDIMVVNNYTDLRDVPEADSGGCSTFAWRHGDHYFCGQTWDMHASARPYVCGMITRDQLGITTHMLSHAGCLGMMGINSQGVAVLVNNLNCREVARDGIVWPLLVRFLLRQSRAAEALAALQQQLPASGRNLQLTDRRNTIDVEVTGQDWQMVNYFIHRGVNCHTNHYLGRLKRAEITHQVNASSVPRQQALEDYFADLDPDTVTLDKLASEVLGGEVAREVVIPVVDDDAPATCGGIIADMSAGRGVLFAGLWQDNDHYHFQF